MINKVILIGNVGKDPEVHVIDNDVSVARFPFATSETYRKKDGEKVTTTEWHNIVAWRHLAELCEKWINKGQQLYIEGKIQTRSYDDKSGDKRYVTDIIAYKIQMLGKKDLNESVSSSDQSHSESSSGSNIPAKNSGLPNDEEFEDLPF